jgi:hypothetical protein
VLLTFTAKFNHGTIKQLEKASFHPLLSLLLRQTSTIENPKAFSNLKNKEATLLL